MKAYQSIRFYHLPRAMILVLCMRGDASNSLAQDAPDVNTDNSSAQRVATVLDLIPDDAALAVAVPNLE